MKKNEKALTIATALLIAFTALYYNVIVAKMCFLNSTRDFIKIDYFEFALCTFLGLMFLGVGITMVVTVRHYSPKFY